MQGSEVIRYKYLIVDDDELSRLSIEAEAAKFPFLQKTASCSHATEAAELISMLQPEVVFADIEMPGISGIDLVRSLSGSSILPVFITSHPEFAVASYELQAFDYLLKPISAKRFEQCALRLRDFFELKKNAFAFHQEQESSMLIIRQGHDKVRISLSDVLYLEAMKDYTKLVTPLKNYLVLETMTGIHQRLPPKNFIRIHRSYIINKDKTDTIKPQSVVIHNTELPIGKTYRPALSGLI